MKGKRYVADGRLTIADFALGASLNMTGSRRSRSRLPEIDRWYADLSALPAWRKSLAVPQAA